MKFRLLAALALALGLSQPASAALTHDPSLSWKSLQTQHFILHFHNGEEAMARETAAIAERVHDKLSPRLSWTPREKTHLVLTDRYDFTNGWTTFFPRNHITLITLPPDDLYGLEDFDHWMETLVTHEYTHTLHLDMVRGAPKVFRNILGRFPLLFPGAFQPSWFLEGLATHMETDDLKGIGRGQSSLFRALMRMELANGFKPLKQVNQPLASWPGGTTPYLYGVYFYRFIAERYGEAKVEALPKNYSGYLIPFMINTNSNRVLKKPLTPLWAEFNQYIKDKFADELSRIQAAGITPGERLTRAGYRTGGPRVAADGSVYFVQDNQDREDQLMRLTPGASQAKPVTNVHGRSFDLHPTAGIALTQIDLTRNSNYFSDIYHIDPKSGQTTRLTHGGRYNHATWSPDGNHLLATHFELGHFSLRLLDSKGKLLDTLWQTEDDTIVGPLDWSPTGTQVVASVWRHGHWNLERFDTETRQWQKLSQSANVESQPLYDASGEHIVFSADYGGVYNIQRLTLADGRLETLTNELGGAFQGAVSQDGNTLYYTALGTQGTDLFRTPVQGRAVAQVEAMKEIPAPTPAAPTADVDYPIKDYNALPYLRPTWWFPYAAADNYRTELGLTTSGTDPLYRHQYSLSAAYDFSNNWGTGGLAYTYDRWQPIFKLYASRLSKAYINSNDTLNRFRFSDFVLAEVEYPFLRYARQFALHAGALVDEEKDARLEKNATPWLDDLDRVAGLAVSYNSARDYPRSISPSYGRQINLVSESSDVMRSDYTGTIKRLDWRELIGLGQQHVLSLRAAGGWGEEHTRRFKLGGVFSDYTALPGTPSLQSLFNRRSFALRGYPEGFITGQNMALGSVEWRFPIQLVERGFMSPPIGIHQWHGKAFFDSAGVWGNTGNRPDTWYRGAGMEVIGDLVFGYNFGLQLGVGVAKGFDQYGEKQLYLRLGSSF